MLCLPLDCSLCAVFINPSTGRVWRRGDSYTNPVLGATLATIARGGAQALYTGQLGERLVADLQDRASNQGFARISQSSKRPPPGPFLVESAY